MLGRYFSFQGRLNRQPFWLRYFAFLGCILALYAAAAVLMVGIGSLGSGTANSVIGIFGLIVVVIPFVLAFYVSIFSLAVRRLHDRNKSGWWILLPVAIGAVQGFIQEIQGPSSILAVMGSFGTFIVFLWFFVELGFLRGTDGPNRFGPNPLGVGEVDVEVFE
ncbi:DUF805 domain-containing protein [Pseudahrensia aquimaris]|uniref:DUF805 domain-containing protein n=1 Tax=Pseudahrensia aquimaris TaxID=744461 RepID=A0ABW3FHD0_9HYPH